MQTLFADVVIKRLRSINDRVKSITFDNGKEFAEQAPQTLQIPLAPGRGEQ